MWWVSLPQSLHMTSLDVNFFCRSMAKAWSKKSQTYWSKCCAARMRRLWGFRKKTDSNKGKKILLCAYFDYRRIIRINNLSIRFVKGAAESMKEWKAQINGTYLESILVSRSKWSRCSSRNWNKFNKATGGSWVKLFPLIDKYDRFESFESCCVGTIYKNSTAHKRKTLSEINIYCNCFNFCSG